LEHATHRQRGGPNVQPLAFFVWLDRKSRALSCDMAAWANAFGSPLVSVPPCRSSAVGLAPVLNPELPAGLGGLGAEDGLVKTEAVGQGGEGHAFEIIRRDLQTPN